MSEKIFLSICTKTLLLLTFFMYLKVRDEVKDMTLKGVSERKIKWKEDKVKKILISFSAKIFNILMSKDILYTYLCSLCKYLKVKNKVKDMKVNNKCQNEWKYIKYLWVKIY